MKSSYPIHNFLKKLNFIWTRYEPENLIEIWTMEVKFFKHDSRRTPFVKL